MNMSGWPLIVQTPASTRHGDLVREQERDADGRFGSGGGSDKPAMTSKAEAAGDKAHAAMTEKGLSPAQAENARGTAIGKATAREANGVLKANGVPQGEKTKAAYTHDGQMLASGRGGAAGVKVTGDNSTKGTATLSTTTPSSGSAKYLDQAVMHLQNAGFKVEPGPRGSGWHTVTLPGR